MKDTRRMQKSLNPFFADQTHLNNSVNTPRVSNYSKNYEKQNHNTLKSSPIENVMESMVFPCCGQNMFRTQNNSNFITDMYIMPCGHNMCGQCICTIIQFKHKNTISCSNPQCTRVYTTLQAEQFFIKNIPAKSLVERLLYLKAQFDRMKFEKQGHTRLKNSKSSSNIQLKKDKVHFQSKDIQIDEKRQVSSSSSEGQTFNPCVNIFCKKPTLGFFCSIQCERIQDILEDGIFEGINFINNKTTFELQNF